MTCADELMLPSQTLRDRHRVTHPQRAFSFVVRERVSRDMERAVMRLPDAGAGVGETGNGSSGKSFAKNSKNKETALLDEASQVPEQIKCSDVSDLG